jgi:hypothetical protein
MLILLDITSLVADLRHSTLVEDELATA